MIYFKNIWVKLKYSHILRLVFDALSKFGIWGTEEIKAMALIPSRSFSEEVLLKRLKDDCKCLGLKHGRELVAFSWCNLRECSLK